MAVHDSGDGGRRVFRVDTAERPDHPVFVIASTPRNADLWVRERSPGTTLDVTDVGHADRTELTQWGLTDRA